MSFVPWLRAVLFSRLLTRVRRSRVLIFVQLFVNEPRSTACTDYRVSGSIDAVSRLTLDGVGTLNPSSLFLAVLPLSSVVMAEVPLLKNDHLCVVTLSCLRL